MFIEQTLALALGGHVERARACDDDDGCCAREVVVGSPPCWSTGEWVGIDRDGRATEARGGGWAVSGHKRVYASLHTSGARCWLGVAIDR